MTDGLRFLAEIQVRVPGDEADSWLYVCSGPDLVISHADTVAPDRVYLRGLRRPLELVESLVAGDRVGGDASASLGALPLDNTSGEWSHLRDYGFGRPARILVGTGDRRDAYTLYTLCTAERPRADVERTVEIPLRDARRLLDVDWQLRWAGTATSGGAGDGGDPDLEDTVQPVALGVCRNFEPPWSNRYDERLMLTAGGAIGGYDELFDVFDKGVAVSVTEHASDGIVELAGSPTAHPTADVRGVGAVSGASTLADVVDWLIARAAAAGAGGWTGVDTAALAAIKVAEPEEIGRLVTERTSIPGLLDELLRHAEGWWRITPAGVITFGLLGDPAGETPTKVFPAWSIKRLRMFEPPGGLAPAARVAVRYGRNHRVQRGDEFDTAATASRKGFMEREWREAIAEDTDVLEIHPDGATLERDSLYDGRTGAAALAARLLALYGPVGDPPRLRVAAEADIDYPEAADVQPGTVVQFDTAEHDLSGINLRVIRRVLTGRRNEVTLRGWG